MFTKLHHFYVVGTHLNKQPALNNSHDKNWYSKTYFGWSKSLGPSSVYHAFTEAHAPLIPFVTQLTTKKEGERYGFSNIIINDYNKWIINYLNYK